MKIWRVREEKGEKYIGRLEARGRELFSPALEEKVRSVVGAVARRGDRALTSLVRRHDLKSAAAASFRLHGRLGAAEEVDDAFSRAVETALANLMAFHQPQAPRGYSLEQRFSLRMAYIMVLRSLGSSHVALKRRLALLSIPPWFLEGLAMHYAFPMDTLHATRLLELARTRSLFELD
ncbi:MAG: histidinol dehydrogenase, partial [Acidobacteriota bacterium]